MAILSIRGLYEWDNSIFDGLTLPDGMDRAALLNLLVSELAELEVIYPDPDRMKSIITSWSKANYSVWDRAWKALQLEYNPIWNVDGDVIELETRNLSRAGSSSGSNTFSEDHQNKVAGFNGTDYQNREQNITSNTDRRTDQHNDSDTGTIEHKTRRTGNIGVTTSQQMLREELEIAKTNIYNWIIEMFKAHFCVMVY